MDQGRKWNEPDSNAPISNESFVDNFYNKYLLINLSFTEADSNNYFEDISGNDNRGEFISDYKVIFDGDTRKPSKPDSTDKPNIGDVEKGPY